MGRAPCCSKVGLHRGAWSNEEDKLLTHYIQTHGEGQWRSMPSKAGLLRCGKSCRLRWVNYLRPGIKRGSFTSEEDDVIIRLRAVHGNRWSFIANELPGRTDNEIKNYWNSHLKRKAIQGTESNKKPNNNNNTNNKKNKKKRKTEKKSTKAKLADEIVITEQSVNSSSSSQSESLTDLITWPNWSPLFEINGHDDDQDLLLDGCDLVMWNDDESEMLEKLYCEYLNLLGDEDGV